MPNNGTSKWTDERIELLKKLWADGLSCSQIAGALPGFTRNAIIGKVHRLGLSGRDKAVSSKPAVKRPRVHYTRVKRLQRDAAARAEPVMELPPETPANAKLFDELGPDHCRWPCSGEPPNTIFCGGDVLSDYSYCPRHCRMAYRPPDRRSRAEIEIAQRKMARAREAKAA